MAEGEARDRGRGGKRARDRPYAESNYFMERMQARSEVLMRFARPRPPLSLSLSGRRALPRHLLARTEWPAQQQRPASGLRNEASVWHAPSAAPGQAPGRPQGETTHTLGAQLPLIVEKS